MAASASSAPRGQTSAGPGRPGRVVRHEGACGQQHGDGQERRRDEEVDADRNATPGQQRADGRAGHRADAPQSVQRRHDRSCAALLEGGARAFIATSSAPMLAPHTTSAPNNVGPSVASASSATPAQHGTLLQRATRRLPYRATSTPVGTRPSNEPAPPPSSARPSAPTLSPSVSWTAGIRDTHMPLVSPCRKNTTDTATRADFTDTVCGFAASRRAGWPTLRRRVTARLDPRRSRRRGGTGSCTDS